MAAYSSEYHPGTATSGQFAQQDGYSVVSPIMSRAESIASDGRSSIVSSMTANVPSYLSNVRPTPDYISPVNASQIATESQYSSKGSVSEDEDPVDRYGRVAVAEGAVALTNSFLDKLLYDFLSTARSTSFLALKPAVADVLKKSLARDAIARAEGDVEDLLALQDSDDEDERLHTPKESGKWNLEFIWKRARLRVMMRSDKSDFDIDDDERYMQEEGLLQGRRFSQTTVISLSAEIFLAGVLDFVAEQLLSLASSSAAMRTRRQGVNARADPGLQTMAHVLVQEPDIEKAALNSSMERLWRNWRKSLRSRGLSFGRRSSIRSYSGSPGMAQRESISENSLRKESTPYIPDMNYPEHVLASNIPLPMNERDVAEIETPWLARDPDEKVPQSHVTHGRFNHRSVKSVNNFSYFTPVRSHVDVEARPATSPQPIPTPFVDAPGAWPEETPTKEISEPEPADKHVDSQDETGADTPTEAMLGASTSLSTPITQVSTSQIPTLDPSQLETADITEAETPSAFDSRPRDEAQAEDIPKHSQYSTSHVTAGAAGAGRGSDHRSQHGEPRLSEEFKRKSLGDMKTLVDTHSNTSSVAPMGANGTFLVADESDDEDYPGSTQTTQSYNLNDRSTTPVVHEKATRQHMPIADVREAEDQLAPAALVQDTSTGARTITSILPHTDTQTPQKGPLKADRRPPRLPLSPKLSPGRVEKDRSQDPTSPNDFLISRNLSPSSSPRSAKEPSSRIPSLSQNHAVTSSSPTEAPKVTDKPQFASKESPRALQGLGISRLPSDDFINGKTMSPTLQQKGAEDYTRVQRTSQATDSNVTSAKDKRSSLKPIAREGTAVMDEDNKSSTSLSKLTSASISSPEDFDMMLQSTGTLKYTLTPESARDVPTSAFNPQVKVVGRSRINGSSQSISSVKSGKKQSPPVIDTDMVGPRPSRSVNSPAGVSPATVSLPKDKQKLVTKPRDAPVIRPTPKNAKPTSSGQLAREPQVQTSSTRDFADFIRTTGPDKGHNASPPLLDARSTQSLRSMANSHSSGADRKSSLAGVANGKHSGGLENVPPMPSMPSGATPASNSSTSQPKTPSHLHARAASGAGDNGTTDLIDFIRNGPKEQGGKRIPRNVAPFRNTMDSDEMNFSEQTQPPSSSTNAQRTPGLSLQTGLRPDTGGSASVTSLSASARSSTKSQARLLPNGSNSNNATLATTQPAYSAQPGRLNVTGTAGKAPVEGVERKRHRNKDPYYIEDSEDDDLLTALPQDRRPEESLIDFLRNSEPPADNAPKPLAAAGQAQARAMVSKARANSVNSLRAATASTQQPTSTSLSPITPHSPFTTHTPMNAADQTPDSRSIAPSVMSTTSNTTMRPAHITSEVSSPGSVPRNPNRAKMQVRDAGVPRKSPRIGAYENASSGTGDLADFLRNSGPPEPLRPKAAITDSAPAPVLGRTGERAEKKSGMKFWKKKTYLDMP